MQVPRTDQMKELTERVKVVPILGLTQIPEQIPTVRTGQEVWQVPLLGQQQTPLQEQTQIQKQIQIQITRLQPPPQLTQQPYERPLPPERGLPFPPFLPQLPGGGGGFPTARRPRKFWEYFPVGLDITARMAMGGARGHTKKKKGRLIPAKRAKKK
jgi:hypothetical protein